MNNQNQQQLNKEAARVDDTIAALRSTDRLGGCLWIDVEVSPGSRIEDACQSAVRLANQLGQTIWFDFNGVKCGARPGDDWRILMVNWSGVVDSKSAHKVACANPPNSVLDRTGSEVKERK